MGSGADWERTLADDEAAAAPSALRACARALTARLRSSSLCCFSAARCAAWAALCSCLRSSSCMLRLCQSVTVSPCLSATGASLQDSVGSILHVNGFVRLLESHGPFQKQLSLEGRCTALAIVKPARRCLTIRHLACGVGVHIAGHDTYRCRLQKASDIKGMHRTDSLRVVSSSPGSPVKLFPPHGHTCRHMVTPVVRPPVSGA